MAIKRKFSPVRSDDRLEYIVTGDTIQINHYAHQEPLVGEQGEPIPVEPIKTTDTFDFTGLPNGAANVQEFETELPINPFISAKRVDGVLEIEVINFIGANATEAERFPEWEVVE